MYDHQNWISSIRDIFILTGTGAYGIFARPLRTKYRTVINLSSHGLCRKLSMRPDAIVSYAERTWISVGRFMELDQRLEDATAAAYPQPGEGAQAGVA